MKLIYSKQRNISDKLVRKHFFVQDLGDLLKKFKKLNNDPKINQPGHSWLIVD